MKDVDVLKLRLKLHPNSDFKMYHYYLGILKFDVSYREDFDEYIIKCKFNKYNPITYLYKAGVFIRESINGSYNRYKLYISKQLNSTYYIFMENIKDGE